MKNTVFKGSAVALITPFNADGSINFEELGSLIEFQIAGGTDAILACGTTGEPATMNDAEHLSVIEYTVKRVAGRVPVIAGTGSNDTVHGIALSRNAQKLGADALLLVTPYYNKTTQRGLVAHFTATADAVEIPCILYNVPSRTGVNIAPETLAELSNHPRIVGIKEASGDIAQAAKILALCGDKIDVYSGNDDANVALLSLGAVGTISVLANIAPQKTHDMVAQYLCGNTSAAAKLQLEAMELISALFCEVNPIPVKAAAAMMGFDTAVLRLPLCTISESGREKLRNAMIRYGLKVK
ncbi:MAG: 4-hydroxy-tetrahydrodipicolinate synthase [Clostridia bacterium]|nr:4-hydroxy-tetrahydrodipicolinate synthase [Clostridia bacterium]